VWHRRDGQAAGGNVQPALVQHLHGGLEADAFDATDQVGGLSFSPPSDFVKNCL
jgi:hypothetical protein